MRVRGSNVTDSKALAVNFEEAKIKQKDILRTNIFPVTHPIEEVVTIIKFS